MKQTVYQLPTPVKPMSKFNTLKQCTFIISYINALAEWFLWLWLGSLGAHLWSGVGCDLALLILAGCGPLLGVQLGAGWSVGTLEFPPHGLFICSCLKLLIELRLFRRKNGSTRGLLKPRLQINTA